MKKIVSFEKEIDFPSMIGEVTSISLDHTLEFIDSNSIAGEFIINGTYKMTEASTLEEKFNYNIPVDITVVEKFDLSSVKISIDNFYYEIVNDDILKCNIDLLIDGIEEIVIEEENKEVAKLETIDIDLPNLEEESVRECDGDIKSRKDLDLEEDADLFKQDEMIEKLEQSTSVEKEDDEIMEEKEEMDEKTHNISSLFESFEFAEETFKTYSIYILRKEDTIEKVMDKYKVSKEQLSDYNDLSNLEIGSKLIIPSTIDE